MLAAKHAMRGSSREKGLTRGRRTLEGIVVQAIAKIPITLRLVPMMVWGRENFQKAFSQGIGV
jgi:hypothetical protein